MLFDLVCGQTSIIPGRAQNAVRSIRHHIAGQPVEGDKCAENLVGACAVAIGDPGPADEQLAIRNCTDKRWRKIRALHICGDGLHL